MIGKLSWLLISRESVGVLLKRFSDYTREAPSEMYTNLVLNNPGFGHFMTFLYHGTSIEKARELLAPFLEADAVRPTFKTIKIGFS